VAAVSLTTGASDAREIGSDRASLRAESGRVLLDIEGVVPDRPVVRTPGRRLALSRFAVVRAEHGHLVVEHPRGPARAVLVDPGVASLLAQLASATDGADHPEVPGLSVSDVEQVMSSLFAIGVVVAEGGEDLEPVTLLREPHDVWFHAASRRGGRPRRLGATWRGRRQPRPPPPAVAVPDVVAWHALADPTPPAHDPGLLATMAQRRSRRAFGPLDVDQLGALLWHSMRIVESRTDGHGWEITRRPFASGGGCHDLDAYVVVGTVGGLPSGVWWYDPRHHRLGSLGSPGFVVGQALVDAAAGMGGVPAPPAVIVLASRFDRMVWKYEGIAYALTLKNVGAAMATIGLAGEAHGLAICPIGLGDTDWFAAASGLDPWVVSSVGELALGGPVGGGPVDG
jgi:oxazoline/thiazoline dehydrogenase